MEAIFATLTDEQRVETLNNVYQKGISVRKEELAFSSDKLVYLKPFIARLLNTDMVKDLNSRMMIRQMVDELLTDILDEVTVSCSRKQVGTAKQVASDYGLSNLFAGEQSSVYDLKRVA